MHLLTLFHRFLTTLPGFTILLMVFLSIGIGFGTVSLQQMNQESRQFVDTTMLNLLTHWDNTEFFTYTSDELQKHMTTAQLHQIKWVFARLGNLLNYHGATGGLFRSQATWWHIGARYKVQAHFEGGQFVAIVTLIKQDRNWAIGRFDYKYHFQAMEKKVGSLILV